ncbi:MAG: MarR family transcriptional regulator [Bryobacterales bacterium]|nr:MarR family transcriptional regulator [Bryobacterales bacterium]
MALTVILQVEMAKNAMAPNLSRVEFYRGAADFMDANQPEFDRVTFEAIFALISGYDAFTSHIARRLQRAGLSPAGFNILIILNQPIYREEGCRLSQLGKILLVSKANVTGVLDSLVKRGLAERIDSPLDRRVKLAKSTPAGAILVAAMLPSHFREIKRISNDLTANEKRHLRDLLLKLRQSVLEAGEDPHDKT